jgi:hypothetical protein
MMGFRIIGGAMYLVGTILMGVNILMTVRSGKAINETREVVLLEHGQKLDAWHLPRHQYFYLLRAQQ